jgi:hypothetical protein
MRAPVVPTLAAELLALDVESCRDEQRATVIEQPVGLRLPMPEWASRIEAIHDTVTVQEQQPILRTAPGGEEQQRELPGRENAVLEQRLGDLQVTLGQMACEVKHPPSAHPPPGRPARKRGRTHDLPPMSAFVRCPDLLPRRRSRRIRRWWVALCKAPSKALAERTPERSPLVSVLVSCRTSASRRTASCSCSSLICTLLGF